MTEVQIIQSFISLPSKREVLKMHFYCKIAEMGMYIYPKELELLAELYERGGYHSKEEMDNLCAYCIDNNIKNSKQSFNNAITKFVNLNIVTKQGMCKRRINPEFVPPVASEFVGLNYRVVNAS